MTIVGLLNALAIYVLLPITVTVVLWRMHFRWARTERPIVWWTCWVLAGGASAWLTLSAIRAWTFYDRVFAVEHVFFDLVTRQLLMLIVYILGPAACLTALLSWCWLAPWRALPRIGPRSGVALIGGCIAVALVWSMNSAPTITQPTTSEPVLDFLCSEHDEGTQLVAVLVVCPGLVHNRKLLATPGLAIVGADTSQGHWLYSLDGGHEWRVLADDGTQPSESSARLLSLDPLTRVKFVRRDGFKGIVELRARAWDGTDGAVPGSVVDTRVNGGGTALSSNIATLRSSIRGNDPPSVSITARLDPNRQKNLVTVSVVGMDPNATDKLEAHLDWNDGTPMETYSYTPGFTATHEYRVQYDYQANPVITVYLTDNDSGLSRDEVSVALLKPLRMEVAEPRRPYYFEQEELEFNVLVYNAAGPTPARLRVDWGDGGHDEVAPGKVTHVYLDDGPADGPDTKHIQFVARDGLGREVSATRKVVVYNGAPTITVHDVEPVLEGSAVRIIGVARDAPDDAFRVALRWNSGRYGAEWLEMPLEMDADGTFTCSITATDDYPSESPTGTMRVLVEAIDDDGAKDVHEVRIEVRNVAPSLRLIDPKGPHELPNHGRWDPKSFLEVVDPGANDVFTWHVEPNGQFPLEVGRHAVRVRVSDDDGGLSEIVEFTYIVKSPPQSQRGEPLAPRERGR